MNKFKPGDLVKILATGKMDRVVRFDEDLCGDGCCQGYILSESENVSYWEDRLELVKSTWKRTPQPGDFSDENCLQELYDYRDLYIEHWGYEAYNMLVKDFQKKLEAK